MENQECKCFVRVCCTKQEIGYVSDRFLDYIKCMNYKGTIKTRYVPGDFIFILGDYYEVHFVDIAKFRTWCLGRIYESLTSDALNKIFKSKVYEVT